MVRVLVVATKSPWPPVDGGRLLLWNSLQALHGEGVEVVLVAPAAAPDGAGNEGRTEAEAALASLCEPHLIPVDGAGRRGREALRALVEPWTVARHTRSEVRRKVDQLLAERPVDVVHAEQLQALPQTVGARERGLPVVLRAQNVESDLWRLWAGQSRGLRGLLLGLEGRRLAAWEGKAVAGAEETWALSGEDAARLSGLAQGLGRVVVVPPPFPDSFPADPSAPPPPGEPAVVLMGSRGWRPNEDAVRWFVAEVWPLVLRSEPGALLHLFGDAGADLPARSSVLRHPSPRESAVAFPPGSIQVVPLRVGSGVRIKILEAWARGVPVVGTPQAFAGLEVEPGVEGMVAQEPASLAQAISQLHRDPERARGIVARAAERLRTRHAPAAVGRQMAERYERLAAEGRAARTHR